MIIVGGLLITRRLHLLAMAAAFWLALAVGIGMLAGSGHCMTANWSFTPVCGADFWRVIVTSPEVMIFLFFMITDPKTVPAGHVGRVAFGLLVAVASTLLMAPQTDEWWTKVGLLRGWSWCARRGPLLDRERARAAVGGGRVGVRALATGASPGAAGRRRVGLSRRRAGARRRHRARRHAGTGRRRPPTSAEILDARAAAIDPATFPAITVSQDVGEFDHALAGPGAAGVGPDAGREPRARERGAAARRRGDPHRGGPRRPPRGDAGAAPDAGAIGRPRSTATVRSIDVSLLVPFGRQNGLSLGLLGRGTVTEETYDAAGALQSRTESPFEQTFVMRRATGDRWLNVAVLPSGAESP